MLVTAGSHALPAEPSGGHLRLGYAMVEAGWANDGAVKVACRLAPILARVMGTCPEYVGDDGVPGSLSGSWPYGLAVRVRKHEF